MCREPGDGLLDVGQLRSDWMALVAGMLGARPRSNAMQSRRVLEEMVPHVRQDLAPPATLQHSSAPTAEPPPKPAEAGGQHRHPLHSVLVHVTCKLCNPVASG